MHVRIAIVAVIPLRTARKVAIAVRVHTRRVVLWPPKRRMHRRPHVLLALIRALIQALILTLTLIGAQIGACAKIKARLHVHPVAAHWRQRLGRAAPTRRHQPNYQP
jgi:hypothetical protein